MPLDHDALRERIQPHYEELAAPLAAGGVPPQTLLIVLGSRAAHFSTLGEDRPIEDHLAFLAAMQAVIQDYLLSEHGLAIRTEVK
jgi:hypothetical protein